MKSGETLADSSPRLSLRSLRLCGSFVLFFASGLAALVYEISWSRQIGLLFGNTASAAATVLASYFGGLAIGYWLFASWSQHARRPLVFYGVLELMTAAGAITVPLLLALLRTPALSGWIHHDDATIQAMTRVLACLFILLPATICLGGTLPLMAAWLVRSESQQSRVAWAYGLNTLGGLTGVLLTTIVLLAQCGVVASNVLAAMLSAACGLAALSIGWNDSFNPDSAGRADADLTSITTPALPAGSRLNDTWLLVLVVLAGFGTLALEVLYTRLFSLVFHNSTYNFGLVVAVVLCGLALGAWGAAWLAARFDALACVAWASLAAAAAIPISTRVFEQHTQLDYFTGGDTFAAYMLACLGLVTAVVLPPALILGTLLPLLWAGGRARATSFSALVGRLTASSTLAAAAGALAASFLLLPAMGLWGSFAAIAGLYVVVALLAAAPRRSHFVGVVVVAPLAVLVIAAVWIELTNYLTVPPNKSLVARWEGAYGWIDVVSDNRSGALSLRENINYTHGSTSSAEWERRQGHIPLLLHPQPRSVLFLGLGTGATVSSAKFHEEVASIQIVELIPEVVSAARLFETSNVGVLDDTRTLTHIDDARHFLLASHRNYDVIVSDLFVPWESKTGYLYTVDHYQVARSRLAPGGIFCQWLALWQLGPRELEMIADSFASVFPNTTVWLGKADSKRTILALVGSESPLVFDAPRIDARLARVFAASGEIVAHIQSADRISRMYVGDWPHRPRGALNTDEHPRLEFAMPLTYADHATLKQRRLQQYYDDTLIHLTQRGMEFERLAGDFNASSARHNWQQLQLRK